MLSKLGVDPVRISTLDCDFKLRKSEAASPPIRII